MTRDQDLDVVSPPAGLVSPPAHDVPALTSTLQHSSLQDTEPVVKKGTAGKETASQSSCSISRTVGGVE